MKKTTKKISVIALIATFISLQSASYSVITSDLTTTNGPIDTNLGAGNGGAVINSVISHGDGFKGVDKSANSATLKFTNNSFVQWDTLNVNKGETLNFNAVNGANNLTIINSVQDGMSKFSGNVNANDGIGKLIISNTNGMLFDGAKFTTAGDCEVTTRFYNASDYKGAYSGWPFAKGYDKDGNLIKIDMKNSTFDVYGDFTVNSALVNAESSKISANTLHLTTYDGADYTMNKLETPVNNKGVTFLKAMEINGDVYITNPEGAMSISDGGTIHGNLNIDTKGNTFVNYINDTKQVINVDGDTNIKSHGQWAFVRDAEIGGNLTMSNDGGFVDVGNANVKGNANLTTTGFSDSDSTYNHYVHVIGKTNIDGDLNIEASQNIHIGGYDFDAQKLANGNLNVKGDINAHSTDGHITTTIDTTAKTINYKSDKLNILTDNRALLKADEYKFSSNGYMGGISDYTKPDGKVVPKDEQIVSIMENYTYIPSDIKSHSYTNIAGGKITQLNAPANSEIYIASKGNLELTGANAHNINLTAPKSRIDITGNDVHAKNINVAGETDYLKVEFPSRDYTLNYTNIRDEKVTTLRPDEVVTYELTDGNNGYNRPTLKPGEKTTYLIGPDKDVVPPDEPITIPDEPSRQIAQWVPDDIMQAPVNTPVAFAADLDDDEDGIPIRKNVDGSVTVVRAVPVMK